MGPVGRTGEGGADVAVADPARRRGIDLVAPGHAGHLVAREQDDVEDRRGHADQGLDPVPQLDLAWGAMRHGARL